LAEWLSLMGAKVAGFSLPPETNPNLHTLLSTKMERSIVGDIRDFDVVSDVFDEVRPEVVLHLAAQPLVRQSYADPIETFSSNVMGTLHVIRAAQHTASVKAIVVATTDKVYENLEEGRPFNEDDKLGGHDPYSTSKACAELVASCFNKSYLSSKEGIALATARAGNVIGGGDWSVDRIVPDLVRAMEGGEAVSLRYPNAVRPWLHVLEPLGGYLMLAQHMIKGNQPAIESLNFAPDDHNVHTVADLVNAFSKVNDGKPDWRWPEGEHPKEASLLMLSAVRAKEMLGWHSHLNFDETVRWTAQWYKCFLQGQDMREQTREQIEQYMLILESGNSDGGGHAERGVSIA